MKVANPTDLAAARVAATLTAEGKTAHVTKDLRFYIVPRVKDGVTVDGDVGELDSVTPIVLDSVDNISPADALVEVSQFPF